ncbi:hypothetical protein E8E13_008244 [Curvularia kusanoi]|uniref:Cytochrome c oxidase assembly protein n=1 Tax=Curvularia kusanoi TaxID=90978 RepID=A0A9P4TFN2_CURKU|nr:hypothetical protein E8E13_008244 [Curvularia kusanoi]
MSRASQITLATTCATAIGVVAFVHFAQQQDKAAMHAGVIRDFEQQRIKRERQADFEMQKALQEEYLKYQTVHDSSTPEPPQSSPGR